MLLHIRIYITVLLATVLTGVTCVPNNKEPHRGSHKVRVPLGKKDSGGLDMTVDGHGVQLDEHRTRDFKSKDVSEEHTNSTLDYRSRDGNHSSRNCSESDRREETNKSKTETEDKGIHLDKGGFKAFDRKTQSDDVTRKESEHARNSSLNKDKIGTASHYDASGSEHNKTSVSHDRTTTTDDKEFSLGNKGGVFTHDQDKKEMHDAATAEEGKSWQRSGDKYKDDNGTHAVVNRQGSKYSNTSNATEDKEIRKRQTKHLPLF